MVNNIKNDGVAGNKSALYRAGNQKLEQAKQESIQQSNTQSSGLKSAEKDSVALTPQAKQLKELQKKISESEGFDRKKVEDIKKAIAEGNYKIDYDKLASKLAEFEFDL